MPQPHLHEHPFGRASRAPTATIRTALARAAYERGGTATEEVYPMQQARLLDRVNLIALGEHDVRFEVRGRLRATLAPCDSSPQF